MVKRDLLRKNIICILIAVLIFVFSAPLLGDYTYASTKKTEANTYDTSEQLSNITSKHFDIIAKGKKTVVKDKGWYYKYTYNGNAVYIKATAFTDGSASNTNTKTLNSKLTKAVLNGGDAISYDYVYKSKRSEYKKSRHGYEIVWKFTKIEFTGERREKEVTLQANVESSFSLTYYTTVRVDKGYDKPSNSADYGKALLKEINTKDFVSPTFDVNVKKPGSNKVKLSKFVYKGKGKLDSDKSKDFDNFIEIAYTTGKVLAEMKSGTLKSSTLYKLYKQGVDITKGENSREYPCRKTIFLSKEKNNKKYKCLQYYFQPPVQLQIEDDYSEITFGLNKVPSSSSAKVPTKISVTVTF